MATVKGTARSLRPREMTMWRALSTPLQYSTIIVGFWDFAAVTR